MYQRETACCGLTERYALQGNVEPRSRDTLMHSLAVAQDSRQLNFFVLTATKDSSGKFVYLQPMWFVEALKKQKGYTEGAWILNTNSGNYCCVVTWGSSECKILEKENEPTKSAYEY